MTTVAEARGTINRNVDILFVVDDSPATYELQTIVRAGFPAFTDVLRGYMGGLPNVHIGLASTDLGTGQRGRCARSLDRHRAGIVRRHRQGGCAASCDHGARNGSRYSVVTGRFVKSV